jgi:MFS-type transporter involved in bile tolerance (Atg22 family)
VAWYLHDFGNSAYALVVLLAVYSAYFKNQVVGGAEGSRLWVALAKKWTPLSNSLPLSNAQWIRASPRSFR